MDSDEPQLPADPSTSDKRQAWEVVEEIEDTPVENLDSMEDNSPQVETEEPITMSHSHDYAQQNLENSTDTPDQYYHYPHPPKKPPYLLIGGVALGLIGLALGIKVLFFASPPSESKPSAADILIESTSGSPTPSPQASPSPEAQTVDKKDLKVQVLNGSGVVGAAGKLAQILKSADWANVDTSNASSYGATGVKIQVKAGQTSLGNDLKKALTDDYEDITVKDSLDADSDYDAVITLGKQPGDKSGAVEGASDSADLKTPSDKKD